MKIYHGLDGIGLSEKDNIEVKIIHIEGRKKMREILFRGKRLNGDGWAYGDLSYHVQDYGEVYVFPGDGYDSPDCYEVDPATVGQYTGLTDKNGVKIFEGDIVSAENKFCNEETYRFIVKFGVCGGTENADHPVGYPCFFFEETRYKYPHAFMMRTDPVYFLNAYGCEVIGNIYDNHELLK